MQTPRGILLAAAGAAALLAITAVSNAQHTGYDPALWSGLKYRMIGPERGGRVTTVTGVPSQPYTFYMGSTGGGVWKTTDAGHNWVNVSDGYFAVASMGAVEVSQSNPDIVYAGTGSSKIRSNVSIGRGLYKSTDAGHTWTFIGLRDTGQISTIRVSPTNPDLVYVAALGNPFVPNKERGVYRSTDGGKTWKQVLYLSDTAGAADLELQPGNEKVVFACMWHGQRKPWTIISGAREGGIYKSTDGGDNWTKLSGGLPNELFGRANVAIPAVQPNRVYALIEAKPGSGLYRSEDAGATWTLVNGSPSIITRPFYYDTLGVDPNNPDVVFVGDEGWFKSTDGGKNFRRGQAPHGDHHDIWINPKNSDYMIQSNDGGANVSLDGGRTWSTQTNQPTAEIYQVAVDDQYPYRVYGAQQDNTTVIVPSEPLGTGQEFRIGPGCETGPIIPNPVNPQVVYGSCKGQFSVQNEETTDEMRYWVGAESLYGNGGGTLIYRFQRVSPMEVSPWPPHAVYYGSQYLHRTTDGGVTWRKISPDLTAHPPGEPQEPSGAPITRDATGEEVYSTLYAIRESPVQKGVIWTGSNDGLVYITRDDGAHWENVTPKDLPPGGRVQNIEPSPRQAGTAYVAIYRFLLGDFAPYIYRTKDFGKTWTRLTDGTNGIAKDEPTRVVREDPARPGLLYAGSEFGMYISFDNGARWQSFQLNLPVTPVTDIRVAHKDLVVSTQGRSFWILDDLTPVEQLTDKVTTADAWLYTPREAVRTPSRGFGGGLAGRSGVQYLQAGAGINYYLRSAPDGDISLEVLDAAGKPVRKFTSAAPAGGASAAAAPAEEDFASAGDEEGGGGGGRGGRGGPVRLDKSAGMHRFTWDLRYPGPWQSATRPEGPNGPTAVPGRYAVKLTVGSWSATEPLAIIEDPRVTKAGVTTADLREQFEHNMKVRDLVSEANQAAAKLRAAQAKARSATPGSPEAAQLANLNDVAARLLTNPIRYSQPGLLTHITYLFGMTNATDQKIGRDAIERYTTVRRSLDEITVELNRITGVK
jgi:photosystem II stability/assembly factor-like uncharacterized protein